LAVRTNELSFVAIRLAALLLDGCASLLQQGKQVQEVAGEEWEDQLQEIAAAKKAWPKYKGVFMYV
jgi:hypothetical protein